MATRFRTAAALLAAAALVPSGQAAVPAGEVFARNRDAVLAEDARSFDGLVFFVGRAVSDESRGAAVGFGKARALAWARFDRWLCDTSSWPEGTTEAERPRAWTLFRDANPAPVTVSGAEVVREERTEVGRWLVVLALPEESAAALRPSEDRLREAVAAARARAAAAAEAEPSEPPPSAAGTASGAEEAPDGEPAEPRGLWREDGVTANETMADGQF